MEQEGAKPEYPIFFKPRGKKTTVPSETTILDAAVEMGLKIQHKCGGNSTCGTCRVKILEGIERLAPANEREISLLGDDRVAQNFRLACQSKVKGPLTVEIPHWLPILEKLEEKNDEAGYDLGAPL